MSKIDEIVRAAVVYNNYDLQQREFSRKTKGLVDPRAKEIYAKLEKRLHLVIMDYVENTLTK